MKLVLCADLIPHCDAEFRATDDNTIIAEYAAHATAHHPEPVELTALLAAITAA